MIQKKKDGSKYGLRGPLTPSEEELKRQKTFQGFLTPSEQEDQRRVEWQQSLTPEQEEANKCRLQKWLDNTTPFPPSKWERLKDKASNLKGKVLGLLDGISKNNTNNNDNEGTNGDGCE